jgi:hypothetical protein
MQRPLIVQFWIYSPPQQYFLGNLVYDFNKGYWNGILRTRFGSRFGTEIELGFCLSSILGGLVIKKKKKESCT